MKTPRQLLLDRAVIRALLQCGNYRCPEAALLDTVALAITAPPLTQSEFEESLRYLDAEHRIINQDTEAGRTWKITDDGRMWAKEHRV